ncbi:uncharacterized protein BCR38DRAFT_485025 [Pseudomassariella vexata]|uniref:Uncharacterized protein n=1 Tax=Pseudomassariella vexata TaxID=1141098 RepID=A0A1Y2DXB0_9PEZI|nr:uncharacterized protein BCR38DRAFT_485025 [Pseudomassariella vexata]ORY63877.1 hypothetical protein BCR38DRAFT_485025 [Pseudomassariella vexata]
MVPAVDTTDLTIEINIEAVVDRKSSNTSANTSITTVNFTATIRISPASRSGSRDLTAASASSQLTKRSATTSTNKFAAARVNGAGFAVNFAEPAATDLINSAASRFCARAADFVNFNYSASAGSRNQSVTNSKTSPGAYDPSFAVANSFISFSSRQSP